MQAITHVAAQVLIVDDDAAIREVFCDILTDEGFRVAAVRNGAEALAYLGATAGLPCLILLDLNMPVMSGWEFRHVQLADPRLARVPMVALSVGQTVLRQARNLAADDYLDKPVTYDDLVATAARYCQHAGRRAVPA